MKTFIYDIFVFFLRKSLYNIIWMTANDLFENIDFEIFSTSIQHTFLTSNTI